MVVSQARCVALALVLALAVALVPTTRVRGPTVGRRRVARFAADDEPTSLGGAMAKQLFGGFGAAFDRLKDASSDGGGGDGAGARDTDVAAGRAAAREKEGAIAGIDQRAQSGAVSFDDFLEVGRTFKKFNGKVPGMPGALTDKEIADTLEKFAVHEAIVTAMSADERADPQLVLDDLDDTDNKCPRVQRIAAAADLAEGQVALFAAEFEAMRQSTQRIAAGEDADVPAGVLYFFARPHAARSQAVNADIGAANRAQRRALKKAQKGKKKR